MSALEQSVVVPAQPIKQPENRIVAEFDDINNAAGIKRVYLAFFHEKAGPIISRYSATKPNRDHPVQDIVIQNALGGAKNSILAGVYGSRVMASYSFNIPDGVFRGKERMYALIVEKDSPVVNFLELERILRSMSCEYAVVLSEDLDKTRELD